MDGPQNPSMLHWRHRRESPLHPCEWWHQPKFQAFTGIGSIQLQTPAMSPCTTSPPSVDSTPPGLRFWRLKKYPHLVFYIERDNHIDVWRVLHGARDIPGWMQDPDLIW